MRHTTTRPALVLGPLFLDIVMGPLPHLPEPGTELWTEGCVFAAGGSANQAVALSRLGVPTQLRSFVGEDSAGATVRSLLESERVGTDLLVPVEQQSVTVSLSLGNDRAMVTRGTEKVPPLADHPRPAALLADLRAIGENRSTIAGWRRTPNAPLVFAEVGWDQSGRWDPAVLQHLDLVDFFLPNLGEALAYTRTDSAEDAAKQLRTYGPSVVITCGADGALLHDDVGSRLIPSPKVKAVDPTGAGDTFSAGLAWGLLQGWDADRAVRAANRAAAWSVRTLGGSASAPTKEQLTQWHPEL